MKTEIRDALNEHLKLEFKAWHEYAAMAVWFDLNDLPGFATFFRSQSDEELAHAHRIVDHLIGRDQRATMPAIDAPRDKFGSPKEALEHFLAAERNVSASIQAIYKLAEKNDDQAARIMLEWFITEQVEEENTARSLLGRLKLAGDSGPGLLLIDQELAAGKVAGAAPAE
jgi:ferritin